MASQEGEDMPTVLITGASSGIGKELAREFALRKYNLILLARSTKKLEELKEEIENKNSVSVKIITYDLSDTNIKNLEKIVEENSFEILVNCAGFGEIIKFDEISLEKDLAMLNVNLISPFTLMRLFLKKALVEDKGRVINICSIAGLHYHPYMATYSTTKMALLNYSLSIAEEIKNISKNISVLSVCPGPVKTNFFKDETREKFGELKFWEMSAEEVAKDIMKSFDKKKTFSVVGFRNKFLMRLQGLLPVSIQLKCVERSLRKIIK